ncbi:MAG: MBL fold metallo-hydrolase [Oscillospiraceae bacterium]|nr:MBL fold metallo-hydrolase [Candidatus Ruminococcus equi]
MKKKLSALFLAVIFVLSLCSCDYSFSDTQSDIIPEQSENAPLSVHFIDVGQGDSILLESNGEFVLVDAGESDYGSTVVNYIKSQNADTLKYVIATHPHSDHCGGLTKVINKLGCENFITVETDQSTKTWTNVLKAVDKADANYIDAKVGETYSFGESSFEIMAPLSDNYEGYNNYSVVIKATYKDTSFLLMGDAEKQSEKEMLKAKEDISADVIKLGHHGSSSSSSKEFLKAVNPDYAVISCGKDNDYGHPHKETIQTLSKLSIPYFETDIDGTIVACSNGTDIKFYTERNGEIATNPTVNETKTQTADNYIGNKNSKVFHTPDCSGAKTMSEKNKVTFSSREEAESEGYKPCKQCNP